MAYSIFPDIFFIFVILEPPPPIYPGNQVTALENRNTNMKKNYRKAQGIGIAPAVEPFSYHGGHNRFRSIAGAALGH